MRQHIHELPRRLAHRANAIRQSLPGRDDRGEINASLAWTGAMVLLAVTIAGIIAAKAAGFAESIDFGG